MGLGISGDAQAVRTRPPDKATAETPEPLAESLVAALDVESASSWLDPCAGPGRLVSAALRAGVPTSAILAVDLQSRLPGLEGLGIETILGTDFIVWAHSTDRRFDRIIANPPFVRLSALDQTLRSPASHVRLNGVEIPRKGNYWMPFLLASMRLLNPGGALGFVLPASWEYADYASKLREMCAHAFGEVDVHRVTQPMFSDVADGCVMLVARRFGVHPVRAVRVIRHGSLAALREAILAADFRAAATGVTRESHQVLSENHIRLGDIAHTSIGAVTGDARFFLLNEHRRLQLGLPLSSVRPILSKARHIVASEITAQIWARLLREGHRVWLFDPPVSDLTHSRVRDYLELSVANGGCRMDAAQIGKRTPWYNVSIPGIFDGFVTGMSQEMPWIALNCMRGLTVSNTLYGVRFLHAPDPNERAAWCLSMLSSATAESRARLVREYPQGLLKLEPRDMARLAVPRPGTTAGARELYYEATNLLMSGASDEARALVDAWIA